MKNRTSTMTACVLLLIFGTASLAQKTAGEHVDDSTTTARVNMALLEQSVSDATDINVETSKGVVQLAGFVKSDETKSMAGDVAAETQGVVAVSNRLRVGAKKRSAGRVLDDSILAAKVKYELAENKETSAGKINVEIRSGIVELSGFVGSYDERDAAVKMVAGMAGVEDVVNSIDITR